MLQLPIYMDYSATTPCDPGVVEAMLPYFTSQFGNAASRHHAFGWVAEQAVKLAREQVASLIGADVSEIVFTSGATESNNLALKGVFELYADRGRHIITCVTEHKAVLDTCLHLEKLGAEISYLEVDRRGLPDLEKLESLIRPDTILLAMMYANNETGTIFPVKEISRIARKHGVLFFTDATQAVGRIPVDVEEDGIDLMAFSAHKLYGPKGIGALYIRRKNPRVRLTAQMDGGGHERGRRSGTLNVPGIVGFGKACEIIERERRISAAAPAVSAESGGLRPPERSGRGGGREMQKLRDLMERGLCEIEGTIINGNPDNRLPHICNISFEGVDGQLLLMEFNKDIALSSGSACTSALVEPSYVLKAMGLPDELAFSALRFSLGRFSTREEVEYVVERVTRSVKHLRLLNPEASRFNI